MPYTEATLQLLSIDGTLVESDRTAEYLSARRQTERRATSEFLPRDGRNPTIRY